MYLTLVTQTRRCSSYLSLVLSHGVVNFPSIHGKLFLVQERKQSLQYQRGGGGGGYILTQMHRNSECACSFNQSHCEVTHQALAEWKCILGQQIYDLWLFFFLLVGEPETPHVLRNQEVKSHHHYTRFKT